MADENAVKRILAEYDEIRSAEAAERKKRIKDIHSRYPRIAGIDSEIFERGKKNMMNIWNNPEKSDEYNRDFISNMRRLNEEKNKIISENGIDHDYDKEHYRCEICRDTGYEENGEKCKCFKQRLINEAYAMSNMAEIIKEQNFGTFSFDYYSKDDKKEGISPYENILKIYNTCKRFCENFDTENKSLLFYGGTGLGKTFLSGAIAKEIMDSGKTVVYVRATRMFSVYEDYRFGRNTDKTVIDNIYNCDLLIIDDLGTELNSNNNSSFLFDVVNERIAAGKKMIINTNLGLSDMTKMYSMRFTSRLYEYFSMNKFIGEDIRLQKLKNR